ncbi:MAG: CofH family radical SAM protein, partial [Nitrososphaerales archaeon]
VVGKLILVIYLLYHCSVVMKSSHPLILKNAFEGLDITPVMEKALSGDALGLREVELLMKSPHTDLIGSVADRIRQRVVGDTVTFVTNQILNYTNICAVKCNFCAFYRNEGDEDSYALRPEEVAERAYRAWKMHNTRQVLIQGGVNPNFGIEYYESVFRKVKKMTKDLAIHGLSTSEIEFISRKERMSLKEVLQRLKDAGLSSIPGAGGEILVDKVRKELGRTLSNSEGYLKVMEEAHGLGIPTSVTMMYGHVETSEDRARHILSVLRLQEKTGGFMAFIGWNFEPGNTRMEREGKVRYAAGGTDLLRVVAAARITYQGNIRNIQSSWLTVGIPMAQLALKYGANDWGGTIFEEEVIPATGKQVGNLRVQKLIEAVKQIGRPVAERDNFYQETRLYN